MISGRAAAVAVIVAFLAGLVGSLAIRPVHPPVDSVTDDGKSSNESGIPHCRQTLIILDAITSSILVEKERRTDGFLALRKGMGYCWSVAVAANPEAGKPYIEKWLDSSDPDVRWIMKENLKKKRLERMDASWVETCRARL